MDRILFPAYIGGSIVAALKKTQKHRRPEKVRAALEMVEPYSWLCDIQQLQKHRIHQWMAEQ